jgi:hypothetical protein
MSACKVFSLREGLRWPGTNYREGASLDCMHTGGGPDWFEERPCLSVKAKSTFLGLHAKWRVPPMRRLQANQWRLLALLLCKALSLERISTLRPAFEAREALPQLAKAVQSCGYTMDEFHALLELFFPEPT